MTMLATLLTNPLVVSTLLAGLGWIGNKIIGTKKDTTAGKVATALATSVALMTQFVLTEPASKTPEEMIRAFKGIVAIQFSPAKVDISDLARAAAQPLIDKAIAEAVTEWVRLHPAPASLTMPIAKLVAPVAA
jgi:hypothetical protein